MVQAVLNVGKVPIVPTIPWARSANVQNCGPGFNAQIQALYTAYPQIVKGPDLWSYFKANQSLIGGDGLHPSAAGYGAYRQQWANAMLANVYTAAGPSVSITAVSPMSGAVGSTVTITGSNFVNVSSVTFYDYPSPSFTVVSPTQITAVVPAGTPSPGRWRVVTAAGTAVYDPLFTVTGTPTITGVSPMSGPVGSTVTISGSNFVNVTKVSFYDYPSPSFTVVSPTQITAIVPAGTPSPGRWRVVNPAYSAVYNPLFTVTGTPAITGVSPMSGPVGSTVTISGSNFVNVTKVSFYDYPSPSFTVVSPTQITAIVPAGTPSPGRWRVVNPAYSAVYDPLFTVTTASPPTNTSLPTITGTPQVGQLLTASNGNWSSTTPITYTYQWQSCDSAGNTCTPITNATTNTYTPTTNDQTHTLRIRVTATNNTGPTTATSTQTTAVQAAPDRRVSDTSVRHARAAQSDASCATQVPANPWEPRPNNTVANHTVPSGPINWSPGMDYWTKWIAKRNRVTGNYTGTTDQIIRWAACKWGIDEDLIRAVAVQESSWNMSTHGDTCGSSDASIGSFGLTQIRTPAATAASSGVVTPPPQP